MAASDILNGLVQPRAAMAENIIEFISVSLVATRYDFGALPEMMAGFALLVWFLLSQWTLGNAVWKFAQERMSPVPGLEPPPPQTNDGHGLEPPPQQTNDGHGVEPPPQTAPAPPPPPAPDSPRTVTTIFSSPEQQQWHRNATCGGLTFPRRTPCLCCTAGVGMEGQVWDELFITFSGRRWHLNAGCRGMGSCKGPRGPYRRCRSCG